MQEQEAIHELDSYFKGSPHFIKRLQAIRKKKYDEQTLGVKAFQIARHLGLKDEHIGIVRHYLTTGKYDPNKTSPSIEVTDQISLGYGSYKEERREDDFYIDTNGTIGIRITLNEDTTKANLHDFIDREWQNIKRGLDLNYPGRRKRFTPIRYLDKYIQIADKLNSCPPGPEKARMAEKLCDEYNISETGRIYKIAKKYMSILGYQKQL